MLYKAVEIAISIKQDSFILAFNLSDRGLLQRWLEKYSQYFTF